MGLKEMILMRRFQVEYGYINDEVGAISSSDIIMAHSKYEAKRTIKRRNPTIVIKRIIPLDEVQE